jgi:hypothetical protein
MDCSLMIDLQIIPQHWFDYEPPSICHTGMEFIGPLLSVGGMAMDMAGKSQQADYQEAVARNNAIALQQKANEEAAIGQRAAATESRKSDLVQSRARSLGAASGTAVASPSQLNIEAGIAGQGDYNALSALYEGMSRSRASEHQADLELFKADRISDAAGTQQMASLFSGANNLMRGFGKTGGFDALAQQNPGMSTSLDPLPGSGADLLYGAPRRRGSRFGLLDIFN